MGEFVEPDNIREARDPTAATTLPEPFLNSLITRAEARLKARVPRLAERVASGEVDAELVRSVLVEVIVPVAANPGGYVSETAGDRSHTYGAGAAAARIEFSEADLELLRPPSGGAGIRSARLALPERG